MAGHYFFQGLVSAGTEQNALSRLVNAPLFKRRVCVYSRNTAIVQGQINLFYTTGERSHQVNPFIPNFCLCLYIGTSPVIWRVSALTMWRDTYPAEPCNMPKKGSGSRIRGGGNNCIIPTHVASRFAVARLRKGGLHPLRFWQT